MEDFWKTAAAILLATILSLTVSRQDREISFLITIAAFALSLSVIVAHIQPVVVLLTKLYSLLPLQNDFFEILLKCTGISLLSELISSICSDAGYGSMGKVLQFTGSAVILSLSIPVFQALITLMQNILSKVS